MLVDFRKLANITTPCQAIQIRRFRQSNIFLFSCLCVADSFLLVNNYQHTVFRNNHRREKQVPYQIDHSRATGTSNNNSKENRVKYNSNLAKMKQKHVGSIC